MKRIATVTALVLALTFASHSAATSLKLPHQNSPRQDTDANALFIQNCASCHGKDGRAKTFKAKLNHARDLTNHNWQETVSDEHIYNSILKGNGKMPASGKKLTKPEIAALVTYVRMLRK